MVIEADKDRAICIIEEEKVNKMIEMELNNQNRYHSLKKDNIDNVRSKVNKRLKELTTKTLVRRAKFICSDQTSLNEEIYIRKTM